MINDKNNTTYLSYGSILVKEELSSLIATKGDSELPIFFPYNDDDSSTSVKVILHSSNSDINSKQVDHTEDLGTATITSTVASITKNLVGGGVLSLSGGIAIFSDSPKAIIVATLWIVILGVMFGYFCLLIAKAGAATGYKNLSYREIWEKTMGERGGLAVALVQTLLPAQGDLSCATVLSYTMQSLLKSFHIHWSRVFCLLFLTVFAFLPLCLMKNLDSLTPYSTAGVVSIGVVMVCATIRFLDGSYQPGGKYYADIDSDFQPSFGNENDVWSVKVLPFVCMVFQSYAMHYNAPRFYTELKDATVSRFTRTVGFSFGIASVIYISIAAAGFLTFGSSSSSYILNNYSPEDSLANASRVGVFFSILLLISRCFYWCERWTSWCIPSSARMANAEKYGYFLNMCVVCLDDLFLSLRRSWPHQCDWRRRPCYVVMLRFPSFDVPPGRHQICSKRPCCDSTVLVGLFLDVYRNFPRSRRSLSIDSRSNFQQTEATQRTYSEVLRIT